jgi:Rrf2 family transcriptional regulator, cysteine metabolism repressor
MQFSTKAEYGLRAVIVLAKAYPKLRSVNEISREENISAKYLEQLFGTLKQNDIILSYKGKSGGYTLSKSPSKMSVAEIIETLEGSLEPMKCQSSECINAKCPSKIVWVKLGKEIRKTLKNIKLSEL